jgi:hypothetical protein
LCRSEHKKYVVQVLSLRLTNRPFSEHTNSGIFSCVVLQLIVVVVGAVDEDLVVVTLVVVEHGHWYKVLQRCSSGSKSDPKGQEYSVWT